MFPTELHTSRLFLRPWNSKDADALLPILEDNYDRLSPWIPPRVFQPAPIPMLAERLSGFELAFRDNREWRYALFSADDAAILGEVSVFSRSANGRVPFADADRAEIGYWLREEATGRGLATEATQAMLDLVATIPRFTCVEIRCDEKNDASGAVPRRLGFTLAQTIEQSDDAAKRLQVWVLTSGPIPSLSTY